jgi:hypothetical protein
MTMHLVGPYLTTTNYKKRKTKMTKARALQLEQGHKSHNKFLKSIKLAPVTYDEYVDYVHGRTPHTRKSTPEPLKVVEDYRRQVPAIPSLPMSMEGMQNACAKKESQRYTGTLIKGIATMHKSNAVPVINDEQAREISQMRRG